MSLMFWVEKLFKKKLLIINNKLVFLDQWEYQNYLKVMKTFIFQTELNFKRF